MTFWNYMKEVMDMTIWTYQRQTNGNLLIFQLNSLIEEESPANLVATVIDRKGVPYVAMHGVHSLEVIKGIALVVDAITGEQK